MVEAKTLNTLLGFSAVIGLLSGLIFIAFVASWAPWMTYQYTEVPCVITGRQLIDCCRAGSEEPCESGLVAFEVDMIGGDSNYSGAVLGLRAPYSGPVSHQEASEIYNETAALVNEPDHKCSVPLDSGAWDRVWLWSNSVANLTGCDKIPVLGEVVYIDSARAAQFQETFLGIWAAFLVVMAVCIVLLVVTALLSNKAQPAAA